jgi:hypothetical protein
MINDRPRRRVAVGALHKFLNVWDRAPVSADVRPMAKLIPVCTHDGPLGIFVEFNARLNMLDVSCRTCGKLFRSVPAAAVSTDVVERLTLAPPVVLREDMTPPEDAERWPVGSSTGGGLS